MYLIDERITDVSLRPVVLPKALVRRRPRVGDGGAVCVIFGRRALMVVVRTVRVVIVPVEAVAPATVVVIVVIIRAMRLIVRLAVCLIGDG